MNLNDTDFRPLPIPEPLDNATPLPVPAPEPPALVVDEFAPEAIADKDPHSTTRKRKEQRSRTRAASPGKVSLTAKGVRAVLSKFDEITHASPDDVALLHALLGVKGGPEELVAHILSSPRITLVGVNEILSIAETARQDPFEAISLVMQHEAHTKTMWGVLSVLGLTTGARPSNDNAASVAIARACANFTTEHASRLDGMRNLIRKGG